MFLIRFAFQNAVRRASWHCVGWLLDGHWILKRNYAVYAYDIYVSLALSLPFFSVGCIVAVQQDFMSFRPVTSSFRCTGLRLEGGAILEVYGFAVREWSHSRGVRGAAREGSHSRGVRGCGWRVEPF